MKFSPADMPDLTGTSVIVTGANAGIGLVTARELAAKGASVVMACRNVVAGEAAAEQIAQSGVTGDVRVEELDLASLASVRAFAARWRGPLDLLINNAGVMNPPTYRETADGHELMFGTNHLRHFALTGLLLPTLLHSTRARVVTVSSIAHHGGHPKVLQGNPKDAYKPEPYYGNTKLANLLFGLELGRRAARTGLVSTMAHPGISATNLVASPDGMGANKAIRAVAPFVMPVVFQSAEKGANPTLYAATLAAPNSYTGPQKMGESRGPIGPARFSAHAQDKALAEKLWDLSEDLTGVEFAL
jgi:NAD(P)-dependent dehydrogenase (short-subunit alcohol dehydrogenase family)